MYNAGFEYMLIIWILEWDCWFWVAIIIVVHVRISLSISFGKV